MSRSYRFGQAIHENNAQHCTVSRRESGTLSNARTNTFPTKIVSRQSSRWPRRGTDARNCDRDCNTRSNKGQHRSMLFPAQQRMFRDGRGIHTEDVGAGRMQPRAFPRCRNPRIKSAAGRTFDILFCLFLLWLHGPSKRTNPYMALSGTAEIP